MNAKYSLNMTFSLGSESFDVHLEKAVDVKRAQLVGTVIELQGDFNDVDVSSRKIVSIHCSEDGKSCEMRLEGCHFVLATGALVDHHRKLFGHLQSGKECDDSIERLADMLAGFSQAGWMLHALRGDSTFKSAIMSMCGHMHR